jgi:hypothetical protein
MQIAILPVWDWINIHDGNPLRLKGSRIFHVANGLGTIEHVSSSAPNSLFNIRFNNGVELNISSRPWRDVRRWRYCILPDALGDEIARIARDPERASCQAEYNKLKAFFTIIDPVYSVLGVDKKGPTWKLYNLLKDISEREHMVPDQATFFMFLPFCTIGVLRK